MINLQTIEWLISLTTLFLAYIISETTSGYFKAWAALKVGDDTPERMGFLSLNPLVHMDPVGLLLLFFFRFGWGKYIPINHYLIGQPYRSLKLAFAYFSDSLAHLVLALIALVVLLITFGPNVLYIAMPMIHSGAISLVEFSYAYPTSSSLMIAAAVVIVATIYLAVLLAVLNFLVNAYRLVSVVYFDDPHRGDYATFLVPMLLIFFLAYPLRNYAVYAISYIGYWFTQMLSMC